MVYGLLSFSAIERNKKERKRKTRLDKDPILQKSICSEIRIKIYTLLVVCMLITRKHM